MTLETCVHHGYLVPHVIEEVKNQSSILLHVKKLKCTGVHESFLRQFSAERR